MAQLPLKINGYSYTVGCADGEEAHLADMAADLDARIGAIRAQAGQLGEARLLVMAALKMADEIHDLKSALGEAEAQAKTEATPRSHATALPLLDGLDAVAARLEAAATRLAQA